jgi:hypothetical protein
MTSVFELFLRLKKASKLEALIILISGIVSILKQ